MRVRFGSAVVIGKFYPPHRGHRFLIETALAQSRQVTLIVCERATDTIPAELRASWLRELFPAAKVMVVEDVYDERDSVLWAELTRRWLGSAPDAVFTSEAYGDPWASALGCVHVEVDRARIHVPVSASAIRANPYAHWEYLDAPVRAYYAKRVCVLGAESTGTTTLAAALAAAFGTVWVPEYGREYSERVMLDPAHVWTTPEFVHIAEEQAAREERAAREANRVLICDTNAFVTSFWHRRYVGTSGFSSQARADLYLLTGDEIPFVQDGFRDGEHVRHDMHRWFEEALRAQEVPWLLVRGTHEERMAAAIAAIDGLFTSPHCAGR